MIDESIRKWGTTMFSLAMMRELIVIDERFPNAVDMSVWVKMLPERYKARITECVGEVWPEIEGLNSTAETLNAFILKLHAEIHTQIIP